MGFFGIDKMENILWLAFFISSFAVVGLKLYPKLKAPGEERRKMEKKVRVKEKEKVKAPQPQIHEPNIPFSARKEEDWKRIGDIMVEQRFISEERLAGAIEHQKQYGGTLTQYLLQYGHISEEQLAQCLSAQFKIPYLPLQCYEIPQEIIDLVPVDVVQKHWLVPVDYHGDTLMVVMVDPLDKRVIDELGQITGLEIIPFVGVISEIEAAMRVYYGLFVRDTLSSVKLPFFVDTKTYKGAERRNSIRYRAMIETRFSIGEASMNSHTLDVSRGGISFESDLPVALGTVLTLELRFPPEITPLPVPAVVQVLRSSLQENKKFMIGAKTLKISKQELAVILKYAATYRGG